SPAGLPLPATRLEWQLPGRPAAVRYLRRPVTVIGREGVRQLQIPGESVSRYHCSLVRTPHGVWVVDLLSRWGVWVNGTRVRCARLRDGTLVRVGDWEFRLRYHGSEGPGAGAALPVARSAGTELLPRTEPGEQALGSLVSQFALLQQQMFDQFQQTVM